MIVEGLDKDNIYLDIYLVVGISTIYTIRF